MTWKRIIIIRKIYIILYCEIKENKNRFPKYVIITFVCIQRILSQFQINILFHIRLNNKPVNLQLIFENWRAFAKIVFNL